MDSRIYILTHKRLTGQLSAAESTELERLNLIPENKSIGEEISYLWNVSNNYFPTKDWNKDGAKKAFYDRIRSAEPVIIEPTPVFSPEASTSNILDWRYIVGVAALVALIIWGVTQLTSKDEVVITAQEEVHYAQILEDTKVWLDKGASIKILEESSSARKIALEGEAFFDVLHNPQKPFTIDLGNSIYAEVLGTSFKASSTHSSQSGKISVRDGRVKLYSSEDAGNTLILEAGEEGFIDVTSKISKRSSSEGSEILMNGLKEIKFVDTILEDAFEELGLRFGVSFENANAEELTCPYTTRLPAGITLEATLDVLEFTYPGLTFSFEDRSVIKIEGSCK